MQCKTVSTDSCQSSKILPWYFPRGGINRLEALVQSGENTAEVLHWSSSIDGDLGAGPSITTDLSPGKHFITLTINDKAVAKSFLKVKERKQRYNAVIPKNNGSGIDIQPDSKGAYTLNWVATSPKSTGKEAVQ